MHSIRCVGDRCIPLRMARWCPAASNVSARDNENKLPGQSVVIVSAHRFLFQTFVFFLFPSPTSSLGLAILNAIWLPAGGCCHCFLFCCLSILILRVYRRIAHCPCCHCARSHVSRCDARQCIDTLKRPFHVGRSLGHIIGTVHRFRHICHSNVQFRIRNALPRVVCS